MVVVVVLLAQGVLALGKYHRSVRRLLLSPPPDVVGTDPLTKVERALPLLWDLLARTRPGAGCLTGVHVEFLEVRSHFPDSEIQMIC